MTNRDHFVGFRVVADHSNGVCQVCPNLVLNLSVGRHSNRLFSSSTSMR